MENLDLSITVLVCVHSKNDFYDLLLSKSLKSLENQTYKKFKTLVVLDECWENTKKTIFNLNLNLDLEIKEKNIRRGLHDAKNFGLKFIETSFVAFLDSDDLYMPEKLQKQVNFLKNNDVDFLGTQSWNINSHDDTHLFESCFSLGQYETHEQIIEEMPYQNILTHGSMVIKKSCLDKLGGYPEKKGMEDWELWNRAINEGYKFYQIQERLYIYRLNTSNIR